MVNKSQLWKAPLLLWYYANAATRSGDKPTCKGRVHITTILDGVVTTTAKRDAGLAVVFEGHLGAQGWQRTLALREDLVICATLDQHSLPKSKYLAVHVLATMPKV